MAMGDSSLRNGLVIDGNHSYEIPSTSSNASLSVNVRENMTLTNSNIQGYTGATVTFKVLNRDLTNGGNLVDDWSLSTDRVVNVGRFADFNNITASTAEFEQFGLETYRWTHDEMTNNAEYGYGDGSPGGASNYTDYWLDPSDTDWVDTGNITSYDSSNGLQSTLFNELIYPTNNFNLITEFPNSVNYSGASGDRYFYRAFKIRQSAATSFYMYLYTDDSDGFVRNDIDPDNGDNGIDDTKLRIDIKLPGPVGTSAPNNYSNSGTQWLSVGWEKPGNNSDMVTQTNQGCGNLSAFQDYDGGSWRRFVLKCNMGTCNVDKVDQTILCRIRFKGTVTTQTIKKLYFSGDDDDYQNV